MVVWFFIVNVIKTVKQTCFKNISLIANEEWVLMKRLAIAKSIASLS